MSAKVISGTSVVHSWAQVIHHDKCAICGEPYTDNSRNSKACPKHRIEYDRMMHRERQRVKARAKKKAK